MKKQIDINNLVIPDFIRKLGDNNTYFSYIDSLLRDRGHKKIVGYDKHHIVLRSKGGSNVKKNIIYLSKIEHLYCHRLLLIENPNDIEIQRAYIACISFNQKFVTKREHKFVLELKRAMMRKLNPMNSSDNRKKIRLTKLGKNNPACRIDQRIVLYRDSNKSDVEQMFYTLKSSGEYIFKKHLSKSITSAMVTISLACQGKITHAYDRYWSYATDEEYYKYTGESRYENM